MKSRTRWPPGGWQILHADAGQKAPFSGGFREAVDWELAFRKKNPALVARHNWPLSSGAIENWVDEQNAARCLAEGHLSFVDAGVNDAVPSEWAQKKSPLAAATFAARSSLSGAALIASWLGSGRAPVDGELAGSRALVCSACPSNSNNSDAPRPWISYLTQPVAERVRGLLAIKHDMDLRTPHDEKLGVCLACVCPLRLKVWAALDEITGRMGEEVRARLFKGNGTLPPCWVLSENSPP